MSVISVPQMFLTAAIGLLAGAVAQLNMHESVDEIAFMLDDEIVHVGDALEVNTTHYGVRTGYVYVICEDPFNDGFMAAYVVSYPWEVAWTEYIPLEMVVAS